MTNTQDMTTTTNNHCREHDIPQRGVNLAKRVMQGLTEDGSGRIRIEVIETPDGSWIIFVNDGKRECLGK